MPPESRKELLDRIRDLEERLEDSEETLRALSEQRRNPAIVPDEQLAQLILEEAADAMLVVDPGGEIIRASRATDRLAGTSVLLRHFDDVFQFRRSSNSTDYSFSDLLFALKEGASARPGEALSLALDGGMVQVLLTAAVLTDAEGALLAYIISLIDITERKRAEEVLRRTVEFDEAVMQNMGEGLYTVDAQGLLTYMNPAAEKLFGWRFEELHGRKMHDMTHHHHPDGTVFPAEECAGLQVLKHGANLIDHEDSFIRRDGAFFDVIYSSSPLRSGSDILGVVVVFRDVSDRKRNERQLKATNEALLRANEDLNQFAFAASHDLQEPLRMITSYSQLLIKGYRGHLDGEAALCVDFITEGSTRMRDLLADLLAYAQLGDNGNETSVIELDLVLQKAIANCHAAIAESQAVVASDPLPRIRGHEPHFLQLFQNLIGNAIKYRGPQPPRVHVSAEKIDGAWRLAVTDNGMGVAPEHHKRIFGVFKRLHSREIPGTGIGLAICQRVVEGYGGRIWVESQVNEGATFYCTLPAM